MCRIHVLILCLGCGIAAAELALLAGADRVEGCVFGNGERTGNVDIVTLALNFYTQGIDPQLDFSDLQATVDIVTHCNDIPVHPRHPYAGELVHTAFSGSHQDAIKKGFEAQQQRHSKEAAAGAPQIWCMPYLPVDPHDIGFTYDAVIRVNSQSGKGGIAYIVKQQLGLDMPRKMQIAFYRVVQDLSDREQREVTSEDITTCFRTEYKYGGSTYQGRINLRSFRVTAESFDEPGEQMPVEHADAPDEHRWLDGTLIVDGVLRVVRGEGNGPLSCLLNALRTHLDIDMTLREYSEHIIGEGQNARAASYVELVFTLPEVKETRASTESWWGVGVDSDITGSGLRAVLSAVNQAIGDRHLPELKLGIGFYERTTQADISSKILNSWGLELPRRIQGRFFEVVQRVAQTAGGEISFDKLLQLFRDNYGFDTVDPRWEINSFKLDQVNDKHQLTGEVVFDGKVLPIVGTGNGPLSAFLEGLNQHIVGVLVIRDYSEHSVGEGSDAKAASYVQLAYTDWTTKEDAWGVSTDTDVTASILRAILRAASRLPLKVKQVETNA
jgi:2-isopropylmalate synthase